MKTRRYKLLKQLVYSSGIAILALAASNYLVENRVSISLPNPAATVSPATTTSHDWANGLSKEQKQQLLKQYQEFSQYASQE